MMQPDQYIHGWIEVGTGDDKALHGFDVEAKAEHHGHVYGKYDARTHTVLSMDGRTAVTEVRPADGDFRATTEYAADLQQGEDTHRFHAGLERLIGPFS
jgi:hypothetical protein